MIPSQAATQTTASVLRSLIAGRRQRSRRRASPTLRRESRLTGSAPGGRVRAMRARLLVGVAVVLAAASSPAQTPVEAARALVARYHEDATALDRARDLLDAALAKDRQVETMVMLSYVQFLLGEARATAVDVKLAAYERGREVGKRAVELAPKSLDAHLWFAINTARWGETKGILRSLFLLPTV